MAKEPDQNPVDSRNAKQKNPQNKKNQKEKTADKDSDGKNTEKVVPLGDEMGICVHLFARFEMSEKRQATRI